MDYRIGQGWDRHRLAAGRRLVLGGVEIAAPVGFVAHSDGDVLLHALCDALLGACALGDIGAHFPDTDPAWKGMDSRRFVAEVLAQVNAAGWSLVNLDGTIVAETVRIAPHREAIRESLAGLVGLPKDRVSLKAKTAEGTDAVGRGEAMDAQVVVLVSRGEDRGSGGSGR